MPGVIIIERIVLESLQKGPSDFLKIQEDTGLNYKVLIGVLATLLKRKIIKRNKWQYQLNKELEQEWRQQINDEQALKIELQEMFSALVNQHYNEESLNKKTALKVKKVWLTRKETKALHEKIRELNQFIDDITRVRKFYPEAEKTKEQLVLICGTTTYDSLINGAINLAANDDISQ